MFLQKFKRKVPNKIIKLIQGHSRSKIPDKVLIWEIKTK